MEKVKVVNESKGSPLFGLLILVVLPPLIPLNIIIWRLAIG